MAPRYPKYQSEAQLSASVVTPPQIDQAGLREQARGANQLSEAADRVMRFALKEGAVRAKAAGQEAGSIDPRGTLESFGGKRPGYSVYEQAAFDTAVGLSSVNIETEARTAMADALLDFKKNKGDPQNLRQQLEDIRQGYAESIEDLSPLEAAKLNRKLSSAQDSVFLSYSSDYLKQEQRNREATGITLISSTLDNASNIGRQIGSDTSLTELIENYKDSAKQLTLSDTVIATNVEKLKDTFHIARVRGLFASTPDKQNFIDQFEKDMANGTGLARGLSEGTKFQIGRQIQSELNLELQDQRRQAREARVATNKRIAAADKQLSDVNKLVDSGLNVPEAKIAQIVADAKGTGDPGLELKAKGLAQRFELKKYYKSKSPEEIRRSALTYKDLLKNKDVTEQDRLTFEMLERLAANTEASVKKNLAEHYEKVNEPLARLDVNNLSSMMERQQQIDAFAIKMGFAEPASYFTESELTALKSIYNGPKTTNGQKTELFAKIFEGFGDNSPAVLNQIAKNNPSAAQIGAMVYVGGDRDFAHTIMNGQAILNTPGRLKGDEEKIDQTAKTVFSIQLRKVLGTSYEDDFGPILSSVHAAYIGLAAEKGDKLVEPTTEEALKLISRVMGSTEIDGVQHGGVTEYNGKLLMIPNSISTDDDAPNSLVSLFKGNPIAKQSNQYRSKNRTLKQNKSDPFLLPEGVGITSADLKSLGYEIFDNRNKLKKPVPINQEFRDEITLQNFGENKVILTMGGSGQMFEDKSGDPIVIDLNDLIGLRIGEGF